MRTSKWAAILMLGHAAAAQSPPAPQDAAAAIIKLFADHRVVMIGEMHGSIQFDDLLEKLVRSPAFTSQVNDIVVEFGNSLYQGVLDRYIAGEDVPIDQLRHSWEDVIAAPNGVPVPPYHGLYAAVRDANRALPPEHRLRILAGDPAVDWARVHTRDDLTPFRNRDAHYASVVRNESLTEGHKALLIMGALHFLRQDGAPLAVEREMIDARASPYVIIAGSDIVRSYDDVDPRFAAASKSQAWPWIIPMKASWVGALPRWSDAITISQPAASSNGAQIGTRDQVGDAFLFLGPRDSLTAGGEAVNLEGTPYADELRRRAKILRPNQAATLPQSDGAIRPLIRRPN